MIALYQALGARSSTSPKKASSLPGSRAASHDPRWLAICAALARLREQGRHSIRMVDADCGAGSLLILATHHARALGFTAIEGRGIDGSPTLIGRARASAMRAGDPAIGLEFAVQDVLEALRSEEELPADILLWTGPHHGAVGTALSRAAVLVIADDVVTTRGRYDPA